MTISYTHSLHKIHPIQLTIKPYYQQLIFLELNPTVDSFFPFISECVIRDLLGFPDHGKSIHRCIDPGLISSSPRASSFLRLFYHAYLTVVQTRICFWFVLPSHQQSESTRGPSEMAEDCLRCQQWCSGHMSQVGKH